MIIKTIILIATFFLVIIFAFCQPAGESGQGHLMSVKAKTAMDFLNSIGVNSAISKRGESLAKTAAALNYTGIRWIRTGYEGDIAVQDLVDLHQQCGVKFSYGLLSGGADLQRLVEGGRQLAADQCLLAFEGANEPNNWSLNYKGETGGKNSSWMAVAKLQRDLYASVKADTILKNYPVWSISEAGAENDDMGLQYIAVPAGARSSMPAGTIYADYANCHNYITHPSWPGVHDNQAWNAASPGADCKVDGLYGNYGLTWNKKYTGYSQSELLALPRVTTETGLTIGGEITEELHARLLINMYLAQFKRGWSFTAVYLLRDRSDESGNQQFGFYTTAYAPRQAARYLHNLTTLLSDKATERELGQLKYEIENQAATVHDLLLQKSDGSFELVVWSEKLNGTDHVIINFDSDHKLIVYEPFTGTAPMQSLRAASAVKLAMANSCFVIEIKP